MTRVANENAFGDRLAQAKTAYDAALQELAVQRGAMAAGAVADAIETNALEAHGRAFVDAVLEALNWQVGLVGEQRAPEISREAPVRSASRGTVRFLDYFGGVTESNTPQVRPLLIVETKRPEHNLFEERKREARSATLARALRQKNVLRGGWRDWLQDLEDYVKSVNSSLGAHPSRVVLTNGSWWVVFGDPKAAFLVSDDVPDSSITIFEDLESVITKRSEFYGLLERRILLGAAPIAQLGELLFLVRDRDVLGVMHSLKVRYCPVQEVNEVAWPAVSVAPMLVLLLASGGWMVVDGKKDTFRVPNSYDQSRTLANHLSSVHAAATELLRDVNQRLGTSFAPSPVEREMRDRSSTHLPPLVCSLGSSEYAVVTGAATHFLREGPSSPSCRHHSYKLAHDDRVHARLQVLSASVNPRALFPDGNVNHCANGNVEVAKESSLPSARLGLAPNEAFCPLWPIEQRLCCRTCSFEGTCIASPVFRLSCGTA